MTCRILSSLVLFFITIPSAWACDCVGPPTLAENLAVSEEVFQGQVEYTETKKSMDTVVDPYDLTDKKATFRVKKIWKGSKEQIKDVYTPANDGVCGVIFDLNGEYLVFASRDAKGDLYTTSCSPTQNVDRVKDLETLGPGEAVEA